MRSLLRFCWPTFVAALMMLPALSDECRAQPAKSPTDTASLDRAVSVSLRDVINYGADLFNKQGDHAGCYQAYRTGLITIRPFLDHRPDLQMTIDDGLARADGKRRVAERAFVLRDVLGEVRKHVEPRSAPKAKIAPEKGTKQTETKTGQGVVEKKASLPARAMARLWGKVTYKGQPVAGGWYVTLVSATDKHSFSTYIRADGSYSFKTPLPSGDYTVAIEEGPRGKDSPPARVVIPDRYQNPMTSGLTFRVPPGSTTRDLDLN
jgi:hypothetical protein